MGSLAIEEQERERERERVNMRASKTAGSGVCAPR